MYGHGCDVAFGEFQQVVECILPLELGKAGQLRGNVVERQLTRLSMRRFVGIHG